MSSRSREKIALVVFAALIVLSLCGLGWYLFAGHSWNVAASNIDDTFGSMDGYTAIVYAGTEQPEPDPAEALESPEGVDDPDDPARRESPAYPDDPASDLPDDAEASSSAVPPAASSAEEARPPLDVAEVEESYEGKGAAVFALDTLDPSVYEEGVILKKGRHRFGVFSVEEPPTPRELKRTVAYFAEHEVDFVVAVTADKAYVEEAAGIDIVVSLQDEGLFVMGETIGGTFYVSAPAQGMVGAILISPSNVVSAKIIEEL